MLRLAYPRDSHYLEMRFIDAIDEIEDLLLGLFTTYLTEVHVPIAVDKHYHTSYCSEFLLDCC